MQKWSLSGPSSICEGGAGVERGISGGPLSPEGLGHGGPQEPSGTEDGEAGGGGPWRRHRSGQLTDSQETRVSDLTVSVGHPPVRVC